MKRRLELLVIVLSMGLVSPVCLVAQSDDGTPLGDVARALRKHKEPPAAQTVIDNDNLSQVMEQAESQKSKGMQISFGDPGKSFQVSSPDVTCSLSFNARASLPLADPLVSQDLPSSEVVKLDGPATLKGDTLQVTVYNGTGWNLSEITVGLTVLRGANRNTAYVGYPRLLPAAAGDGESSEKRPDMTVLYHLKGTAAPFSTAVFRQNLGATLGSDQEWHWAIVQAKGVPPR